MLATKFNLSEQERNSALWQKLKMHLAERLQAHRSANDRELSQDQTAKLRGQIREVKYLLDLEHPGPAIVEDAGA